MGCFTMRFGYETSVKGWGKKKELEFHGGFDQKIETSKKDCFLYVWYEEAECSKRTI